MCHLLNYGKSHVATLELISLHQYQRKVTVISKLIQRAYLDLIMSALNASFQSQLESLVHKIDEEKQIQSDKACMYLRHLESSGCTSCVSAL